MEKLISAGIYDFDGVFVPGEELMDLYIAEFCAKATNAYCEHLFSQQRELVETKQQLEQDRNIYGKEMKELLEELSALQRKLDEHFMLKDQVLEEAEEKYKNKIPYDKIYTIDNLYPGLSELLWTIYNDGIYDQLFSNTHVNSEREIIAKRNLLTSGAFPPIKFFPVKYHLIPFRTNGLINKNREASDKVGMLLRANQQINPSKSIFVDNSKSIITRANELGLRTYFVNKNNEPYIIQNPTLNLIPILMILKAANDSIANNGGKVKQYTLNRFTR